MIDNLAALRFILFRNLVYTMLLFLFLLRFLIEIHFSRNSLCLI